LVSREYGIIPFSCVPGPRGFVAETFIVEDFNGTKVFVKWLPTWASAQAMLRGLAVAERLRALGVPAAAPIRTLAGLLSTELQGRTVAVFEFVEGERGAVIDQRLGSSSFNYDYETFVRLLASIHNATANIGVELPLETFSIPWGSPFETAFRRTLDAKPATPSQAKLQDLMRREQAQIEADWADLQSMPCKCGSAAWTPVLTHGDLLGDNIIVGTDGALHPIDWDDPVLAPSERDTWFFTCDPEAEAAFSEAYRRAFPRWGVDPLRRRYYLFWRFFQDMLGYIDIILDDPSHDRQAWSLSELRKTCFEWLWPPMRSLS
jgi:Ser/Thr protein kinase RdoA (MazF antagonist)